MGKNKSPIWQKLSYFRRGEQHSGGHSEIRPPAGIGRICTAEDGSMTRSCARRTA